MNKMSLSWQQSVFSRFSARPTSLGTRGGGSNESVAYRIWCNNIDFQKVKDRKQPTGLCFKNLCLAMWASKHTVGEITDYRVSHRFPLIRSFLFHLFSQSTNSWTLHTHWDWNGTLTWDINENVTNWFKWNCQQCIYKNTLKSEMSVYEENQTQLRRNQILAVACHLFWSSTTQEEIFFFHSVTAGSKL